MENYEGFIGKLLDSRYRVNSIVGSGGMAVVFEATDNLMNRTVAIKMLKFDVRQDEQAVKRFINESRAVSMLDHPNLIRIYDVSVKDENKYIVMEYIDGITLKEYIATMGKIDWREAISYTQQVLSALQHAHDKGIVHRDVKPQNVILLRSGEIKVADFGIARLPNHETLTLTDKAIGTVHYISPEQASKESVDHKSDIYSVGVMLYEMTTGVLPFTAENPIQIAMMHVNDPPRNPRAVNRDIPKGLAQIILKAMNKNPDLRYKSANSMIKHLNLVLDNPDFVFSTTHTNPQADASSQDKTQVMSALELNKLGVDTPTDSALPQAIKKGGLEKKLTAKKGLRRNRSMLPIISGVTLAFLVILAVAGINLVMTFLNLNVADNSMEVVIPDVRMKVYGEALKEELAKQHLRVLKVEEVYNDNYPADTVIMQDPQPNEIKKRAGANGRIDMKLTISKGKTAVTLADYFMTDYRAVEVDLKKLGLVPQVVRMNHDTVENGYCIETEPAMGTVVKSGDTIKVYVSDGQKVTTTLMPTLTGLDEAKAIELIKSSNLILEDILYDQTSKKPAGQVIDQNVPANKTVPEHSTKVIITVSGKPKASR